MTDVTSSAQSASIANSDSALSAPQPALNCTLPSAHAPRISWVYLFGFMLLAVSVLLPWCLAPFGFVLKEPRFLPMTDGSGSSAFLLFLTYGQWLPLIAAPLAPVPRYLMLLLILWRIVSMMRARSLVPPASYRGIARGAVRAAVGLALLGWGVIASGIGWQMGPAAWVFGGVLAFGFFLLPISIYWVEVKSAYDSFKSWRVCRSAGDPLVSWVYLFGFSLLALSVLLPWCLAPFGFVVEEPRVMLVWSAPIVFQTFLAYGATFSTFTTPLAHVPAYLGSLLILWRVFSMFRARSLLPPSGYSGVARVAVHGAVGLALLYWGSIVSGAIVRPAFSFRGGISLSFLLLPIAIYSVEIKSLYDSFKAWRAERLAGVY